MKTWVRYSIVIGTAVVIALVLLMRRAAKAPMIPTKQAVIEDAPKPKGIPSSITALLADPRVSPALKAEISGHIDAAVEKFAYLEALQLRRNSTPLPLYGEVVDQDGNPVAGATVRVGVLRSYDLVRSETKDYTTTTDALGLFEMSGLQGIDMGIAPSAHGYFFDRALMAQRSAGYFKSSTNNRMVIPMWKIQPTPSLQDLNLETQPPHDGTPVTIDISRGVVDSNGDLEFRLTRDPLEPRTGQAYSWSATIRMLRGGLVENYFPYPYAAPASGYQQELNVSVDQKEGVIDSKDLVVFVHTSTEKYAKLDIQIFAGRPNNPPSFSFTGVLNASGDRNLQPALSD